MRSTLILGIAVISIANLLGCSGSSSGGGGGNEAGGNGPQNAAEALAKLSPEHKKSFESWQQQVAKGCSAAQAFGLNNGDKLDAEGVDGAALIRTNGGSLVFTDNGGFLAIAGYCSFLGTGVTKVEVTSQINGQGYTISAETKREGSTCTVYLFGQKVFETYIAESFTIGSQWMQGKEAKATSPIPKINTYGTIGTGEATQTGIYSLLTQSLEPKNEAIALLSKRLSLTNDQTAKLFRLGNYASSNNTMKIANEETSLWSFQSGNNLFAHENVLANIFDGSQRTLPVELRLTIPEFSFSGTKNEKDGGSLKLIANILISKANNVFSYSTQAITSFGIVPFDKEEALACATNRSSGLIGGVISSDLILPSVPTLFGPCESLHAEVQRESYSSGLMKSLISKVFAGVLPSPQFRYNGWDQVLSTLALEGIEQGKDIQRELDPLSNTTIVSIVANHLDSLSQGILLTKNMSQAKLSAFRMGLSWSFLGQKVSENRVSQILLALDNTVETFKFSTERILAELGQRPNSLETELHFASSISESHKASAVNALSLSKELSYSDFEHNVFNQVLQLKVPEEEFNGWSSKFRGIKNVVNKYPNLEAVKGELVALSLKLMNSGYVSADGLGSIYSALDNSIVPFDESTKALVKSLAQSSAENQESLEFARSLTPEYKQLAISIRSNSKLADHEQWGQTFFESILQKKPSLEQLKAWNEMWTAALAFTQRERARTKDEFGSANEWNLNKVIEVAIEENWSAAQFTSLETIAEVGRAKESCVHHKGYSSLANCGGMQLFSKKAGMFFDSKSESRYVSLATDFAGYLSQMTGFGWYSIRAALLGKFFGSFEPIWSKCDQNSFAQKASALKTQINAILKETDQFKKWELERDINTTIRDCQ